MVRMVQLLDDLLLCTVSNLLSGGEGGSKYCQGCYGVVGIEDDEAVFREMRSEEVQIAREGRVAKGSDRVATL
eukprot:scaffold905_cov223-Alexandrium_tamarense.AAC.31